MSSLDKATNRARERDQSRGNNGMVVPPAPPAPPSALEMVATVEGMLKPSESVEQEVAAKLASGEYEAAPQVLAIPKGQTLIGWLEGKGPPADVTDVRTKEVKPVDTWILASGPNGGLRVSILTTAQLEKKLAPFVGGMVMITRGDEKDTKSGGRVTEYLVVGPKRADGVARSWAQPSRQLAAGGPEGSVIEHEDLTA